MPRAGPDLYNSGPLWMLVCRPYGSAFESVRKSSSHVGAKPLSCEVFAPFSIPSDLQPQSLHSLAIAHQTLSNAANRAARYLRYCLSWLVL